MLDRLLKIESHFARVEAMLLVFFVLLMLSLATYNVFYGNVLVPIQVSMLVEAEGTAPPPAVERPTPATTDEPAPPTDDESGGFGGGFGDERAPEDESGGFGGGFGDPPAEEPDEPAEPVAPTPDDSAGFGGDFGDEPAATTTGAADPTDGFGGGFGGDFDGSEATEDTPAPVAETETVPSEPKEVPWFVRAIDAVKLEWIDVLLRQLVLIVGFLGAMLATRRRKHITIDALSKLMPAGALHWIDVVTSTISIVVCILLAKAGSDLVAISVEYPKELTSWAEEWQFQLAFPVGFGLLAFHFSIRLIESFMFATGKAEPPEPNTKLGGAA